MLAAAGACSPDGVAAPHSARSGDPTLALDQAVARAQASRYGDLVAQAQGCLFEQAAPGGRVRRVAVPLGRLPFALPRVAWRRSAVLGPTGPAAMRATTVVLPGAGPGAGDVSGVVSVSCVVPRAVSTAAFAQLVRAGGASGPAAVYARDRAQQIATRLARVAAVSRTPSTAILPAAARIRRELLGVTAAVRHEQRRAVLRRRPTTALPLLRADVAAVAGAAVLRGVRAPGRTTLSDGRPTRVAGPGSPGRAAARALARGALPGGAGVRPTCAEDPGDPGDPGDDGTRMRGGTPQAMGRAGGTRQTRLASGIRPTCGGDGDPPDPPDPTPPDDPSPPDSSTTPAPPDSTPAAPDSSITPADSASNPVQDCGNAGGCTCDDLGDCDSDWDYYDQLSINCSNGCSETGVVDSATDVFTPAADADPGDFSGLPDDLDDSNLGTAAIGCTSTGRSACVSPGEAARDPHVLAAADKVWGLSQASAPGDPWHQVEYGVWLFRRADGSIYAGQPIRGVLDHVCMIMGPTGGANVGPGQCVGGAPPGAIGEIHTHPTDGDMSGGDVNNGNARHMVMEVVTSTQLLYYNPNAGIYREFVRKTASTSTSGVSGDGTAACE